MPRLIVPRDRKQMALIATTALIGLALALWLFLLLVRAS